ncbi:hypothetical protein FNF31_06405 [Cafeteria roenbergensis]|uniref:Ku domain-containing protein n=1 Tax=Cafeteria roenbergensis TaxID=33653 RepID=A0A5A8CKX6_CAFRO|nr:hypothetical protein FNF31_06405 [Cafeteria roenbergensis]
MARVPNQHIALVLDAGAECQATRPAGDDPVVGGGASTCFDVVRALATQYMLHQMQCGKKGDRFCVILAGVEGNDGVAVEHELARPTLEMVRAVKTLAPTPAAGNGKGTDCLARAAEQGLELLSGVRSNASNATKLVLIACSAAGCRPAAGLDAAAASGADSTAVEVICAGGPASGTPAADALAEFAGQRGAAPVTAADAWSQLRAVHVSRSVPAAALRGHLDIAGIVRIPVKTYKLVARASLPTPKKRSGLAPPVAEGKVSLDRTYRLVDPPHEEVPAELQSSVFPFGRDQFPASTMDVDALKAGALPCLRVLGFVPAADVQLAWLMGPAYAVAPSDGGHGVAALCRGLHEAGRVAVVRYVGRAGSEPQLAALFPYLGADAAERAGSGAAGSEDGPAAPAAAAGPLPPPGVGSEDMLVLLRLPFAEDLRAFAFPPLDATNRLVREASAPEHVAAARALVDAIDPSASAEPAEAAGSAAGAPAGTTAWLGEAFAAPRASPALQPHAVPHPAIARVADFVRARALDPDAPVPGLRASIAAALFVPPAVEDAARAASDAFVHAFALRHAGQRTKRRRAFGFEADKGALLKPVGDAEGPDGAAQGGAKRMRAAAAAWSLPSLGARSDAVGAVNPVGDFKRLLADETRDRGAEAVSGMAVQIRRLAREGALHGQALACIEAFRAGCKQLFEEPRFNALMRNLKACAGAAAGAAAPPAGPESFEQGTLATKGLWQLVQERGEALGLISSAESSNSLVPPEEALAFLRDEQPAPAAAAASAEPDAEPEEDDDDQDDELM